MSHVSQPALPTELWHKVRGRLFTLSSKTDAFVQIIRFATDDDCNSPELQTHPEALPTRALKTKLLTVQVCRTWRAIGTEFLFEFVGNKDQAQLVYISQLLRSSNSSPKLGWWIRSLHTRFHFGDDLNVFSSTIVSILQCCPRLTTFMHIHDFNGPLPTSVVTALTAHCGKSLRRFQLDWGGVNIDDLRHLLETSPSLQHLAVGCTFAPPSFTPSQEFRFHKLRSLHFGNSEDGMTCRFNYHLLEASSWILPALQSVSIDVDARTSIDELMTFLSAHGSKLLKLSLTDSDRLDGFPISYNRVLQLCPNLRDLRIPFNSFTAVPQISGQPITDVPKSLNQLCFAQWEFFPDGGEPDDLEAALAALRVHERYFEVFIGSLGSVLKCVQFDFHAGFLDLSERCRPWWDRWVDEWTSSGLEVRGSARSYPRA